MQYIPTFLYQLYSKSKLWIKIYIKLRWQLCPFEKIERLIPKKARVIDIGCGFGLLANYLALTSEDRAAVGIDFFQKRGFILPESLLANEKI